MRSRPTRTQQSCKLKHSRNENHVKEKTDNFHNIRHRRLCAIWIDEGERRSWQIGLLCPRSDGQWVTVPSEPEPLSLIFNIIPFDPSRMTKGGFTPSVLPCAVMAMFRLRPTPSPPSTDAVYARSTIISFTSNSLPSQYTQKLYFISVSIWQ